MTSIRAPFRIGENLIAPDFGPEGFPPDDENIFGAYRDQSFKSSFTGGARDKSKPSASGFGNPGAYGGITRSPGGDPHSQRKHESKFIFMNERSSLFYRL